MKKFKTIFLATLGAIDLVFNLILPILVCSLWVKFWNINGIFAGGETTVVWTEGQNCLTQEEVEGMFEQIKSWLGVSVCGDQDFSMPDSPYSLQNRLLTTSTGLFITTALGQYIAI